MTATGRGGERRARDAYETPERLARALVGVLPIVPGSSVLVPTAGHGSFVRGLRATGIQMRVEAVEIRPGCREALRDAGADCVWHADFLKWRPTDPGCVGFHTRRMEQFDWAIDNTPFEDGVAFVERAMSFIREGGHCAFLFREGFMESQARKKFWKANRPRFIWKIYERPSYTGSGTDSATYNFFLWTKGWTGTTGHDILYWKEAGRDNVAEAAKSVLRVPFVGSDQLSLPLTPDIPEIIDVDAAGLHQSERFEMFHRANPGIFHALHRLAAEMRGMGMQRVGISLLYERIRWLHMLQTKGSQFKLDNRLRAYFARALMAYDPALDGFFEVRKQLSGEWEPDLEKLGLRAR